MQRSRAWCYTINNPVEADENFAYNLAWGATYTICGKETGEQGTVHLQGYVYFPTLKSLSQMKDLHATAHWEAAKGTPEQNREYCSKDGDFFEWGDKPSSSKEKGELEKERWELALTNAQNKNWSEVPVDILIRYGHGLDYACRKLVKFNLTDTTEQMLWYWGESESGKSRKARTDNPNFYLKMCNKWWDDYAGEDVAIIEDFGKQHKVLSHHLKIWGDRYSFPAEVKGGKIDIRPRVIIVTCNWHPNEIFEEEQDLNPILRRFKTVHFKKLNVPTKTTAELIINNFDRKIINEIEELD